MPGEPVDRTATSPRWCLGAVAAAALVGLLLLADSARCLSATYDEVAYLRIAANWWRTGRQSEISYMGSPLLFWKLQQLPTLWILDQTGHGGLVDNPVEQQARLLPILRIGALWVWLAALGMTAYWARRVHGPRGMAFAAWLFVLSPNLLAHGALITMELPIVASSIVVAFLFWRFLETRSRRAFAGSAAACGVAFSCKFTAILFPPLLGILWLVSAWRRQEPDTVGARSAGRAARTIGRVALGMLLYLVVLLLVDFLVTGGARLPLSARSGQDHPTLQRVAARWPWLESWATRVLEMPLPEDWVGFAWQSKHQSSGGSSYLLGMRRINGWWYYYLVALAVKVPLGFWLLTLFWGLSRRGREVAGPVRFTLGFIALFLGVTAIASTRNYGLRYLLPLSPLAIVTVSGIVEGGGRRPCIALAALILQAVAVVSVHPNELTYFNALAGGRLNGRHILNDSNLDWGQGLKSLARLQHDRPEFQNLTLFYFGDTDPRHYGVAGKCHVIDAGNVHPDLPARLAASTEYVAVSASLQWGPWGPEGYFQALNSKVPVAWTDDTTIAVYRVSDLERPEPQ